MVTSISVHSSMSLFTYVQEIASRITRWKHLRSLPSYTLEELGLGELAINPAELPALSLPQYVDLLAGVPLPTEQQKQNFIEYVSHAHSWYKHLPLYLPGAPFYFFIDKYAACDRFVSRDGTAILKERPEQGFHYSDHPTAEYRHLFGHLAYCCCYGKKIIPLGKEPIAIPRDDLAAVPGDDARMYRLPREIIDAGATRLTAAIHTFSMLFSYWHQVGVEDYRQVEWPQESGGKTTLDKIVSRSQKLFERPSEIVTLNIDLPAARKRAVADTVLYELLNPERTRQYGEMMKAINRVCDLIAVH